MGLLSGDNGAGGVDSEEVTRLVATGNRDRRGGYRRAEERMKTHKERKRRKWSVAEVYCASGLGLLLDVGGTKAELGQGSRKA